MLLELWSSCCSERSFDSFDCIRRSWDIHLMSSTLQLERMDTGRICSRIGFSNRETIWEEQGI